MGWYKGMRHTQETKDKISKTQSNKVKSKEHKENLSISMDEYKRKVYQYDLNYRLVKVWESFKEIEKKEGFNIGGIWQVCNHKRYSYMGYIWSYHKLHSSRYDIDRHDYSEIERVYWRAFNLLDNGWVVCMTNNTISADYLSDKEHQLEQLFKDDDISGIEELIKELIYLDDIDLDYYLDVNNH